MPATKSPRLNCPGRFERADNVQPDAFGQAIEHWSPISDDWAEIITDNGGEQSQGDQRQANMTATIKVRFRDDIKPAHRFIDLTNGTPGRIWNIGAAFDEAGDRNWLTIKATSQTQGPTTATA